MKKLLVPVAAVLVLGLGSYAILAQQANMPQGSAGEMMGGMSCDGCAAVHAAVAATSDGSVIVAAGGKLIKYDAALKKVTEVDIDVNWAAAQQRMPQNCPMMQIQSSLNALRQALGAQAGPRFLNDRCPIMGTKIDPDNVAAELIRVYGQGKVAFCCGGCPAQWDHLTEAQKTARLKEAGSPPPRPTPQGMQHQS